MKSDHRTLWDIYTDCPKLIIRVERLARLGVSSQLFLADAERQTQAFRVRVPLDYC